jgi:hypothetical protein
VEREEVRANARQSLDKIRDGIDRQIFVLRKGFGFGEIALETPNAVRIATVRTREKTLLLTLDRDSYLRVLQDKEHSARVKRKADFIASHYLFKRLSRDRQISIAYFFKERTLRRGDGTHALACLSLLFCSVL